MTTPILPPFVPIGGTYPTVQPFTFRDGYSYVQKFDRLVKYINTTIVPWVETNYAELAEAFATQVAIMVAAFEAATANIEDQVAQAEAAAAAAQVAADLAAMYAGETQELQDDAITAIFNSLTSDFRIALDGEYAAKDDLDAVEATVNTGRLSAATMDARFAGKENAGAAAAEAIDRADADVELQNQIDQKADHSTQETVETGRLSEEILDVRFLESGQSAIPIKLGGVYPIDPFGFLRQGIVNVTQDTRVYVLGSSNANAGQGPYVYKSDQAVFERLSYRCGLKPTMFAGGISGPVPAQGMNWVNGAIGNTTSADYFPASRKDVLNYLQPHYVIHMIGENDLFYGTTIANYRSNMTAALAYIEGNIPGAVNVLVHSHGRHDVPSPVAQWEEYGEVLRELAEIDPGKRIFINAYDYFAPLNTMTNDSSGMMFDTVHLNEMGHLHLANIIGARMGIPSESDYASANMVKNIPFDNTNAYVNYIATGTVKEVAFDEAKYPREVDIIGNMYINSSNATNDFTISVNNGTANIDVARVLPGSTGVRSLPISASLYVPPGVSGTIRVNVNIVSAGNMNVFMSETYSKIRTVFRPI